MRGLAIIALAALGFAYAYLIEPAGDNERSHYDLVRAFAQGTPTIDESLRHPALRTIDVSRFHGHAYAAKAPGLAGASLPAYLALEAAGANTTKDPKRPIWALHIWGVVLPALAMLLLVVRYADRVEPGFGVISAVTLGAATMVLPFSAVFFSHVLSALLGFAAFALLVRERETGPRLATVLAAGVAAGLAITVEYPLGLVAVALVVYVVVGTDRLRRALAYAAGVVAGVLPTLAFDTWAFRSPFHLAYEGWHQPGSKPLPGVFGINFPSLDTFLKILVLPGGIAPLLAPALVGAVLLWRRGDRLTAGVPLLVAALFLAYDSANVTPFGGASPGPRYLIPVLPFLAVPLAAAYARIPGAIVGIAVVAGSFFAGATLTSPLAAWDQHVVHRLTTGGYVSSAASLVGINGGAADAPFLLALAIAAVAAIATTPWRVTLPREVAAGILAAASWAVLETQSGRLLEHGAAGEAAVVAVVGLGAVSILAAYRVKPTLGATLTTEAEH